MPRSESLAPRLRRKHDQDVSSYGHLSNAFQPSLPPTFVPRFHDEGAVKRMTYRRLANTEMVISKISFGKDFQTISNYIGSAPIGGMFGNVEDSITSIVETALKSGINLIDTAYWYGQARSESILGKVLYY